MATIPSFLDTPLLSEAYRFALEAHARRGKADAEIEHATDAARLVHEAGFPEELVAAALLHDVLEETAVSAAELRERFGDNVADLVASVTENAAINSYERRKAALRGQAVEAGRDAAAIFAADKLARMRALNRAGEVPDPRRLAHYREAFRLLRARRPDLPFLEELGIELEHLTSAEHEVALRDGGVVMVRPIERSDGQLFAAAYERMSEESRRRRFITAPRRLTEEDLRYLTDIDGRRHDALVALDPATGDLVGEARYVRDPGRSDIAEVAAVVLDDWQGRGIATALLIDLTRRARARGLSRYKAIVSADNQVVLDALAKLGAKPTGASEGQVELEFELPAEGLSERLLGALRWAALGQVRLVGRVADRVARLVSV